MAPKPHGDIRFLRRVLIATAVFALALLAWYLVDVLLLIFGAVLIAVLLRALADSIAHRTALSQTWALIPATLGILLVVGLAVWLLGAEVRAQVAELAERLPGAWRSVEERLGATDLGERIVNRAQDAAPGAGSVVSGLAGVVTSFVGGLADFLLIVFGGLYLAAQPELYRRGILLLFPAGGSRERIGDNAGRKWRGATHVAARSAGRDDLSVRADRAGPMGDRRPGGAGARPVGWSRPVRTPARAHHSCRAGAPDRAVRRMADGSLDAAALRCDPAGREQHHYPAGAAPGGIAAASGTLFAVVAFGLLFGPLGILFATPLAVVAMVAIKRLWVRDALGEPTDLPGD